MTADGNIFHILNRGVDKRKIFLDDKDRVRFVHSMNDFNSVERVANTPYYKRKQKQHFQKRYSQRAAVAPPPVGNKKVVDILCWTLLGNHVHMLVQYDGDLTVGEYSKKLFGGYTDYFNNQYERSGVLFQGRTKIKRVESEPHFLYLPFYIHSNIFDVFQPDWREVGIKRSKEMIDSAETYRWSNYRDIIGKGNGEFAHITNKDLFFEMFQTTEKQYKKQFEEWVKSKEYLDQDFSSFE